MAAKKRSTGPLVQPIADLVRASSYASLKKLDEPTMIVLFAAARRGLPKSMAAPLAGITVQTLNNWLRNPDPAHAAFAAKWRAAVAEAGADLVDRVAEMDPKWLLSVVHKLRPPPDRIENKHQITGKYTDDELEGELERRGFVRAQLTGGAEDD